MRQGSASGALDTGLAIGLENPVNLRGSLDQLPEEGSRAPERSTTSANRIGASRAGAVDAQPERTCLIGGQGACAARRERRLVVYRRRALGGTDGRRFDRQVG